MNTLEIVEHTQELTEINRKLQLEVAERKRAEATLLQSEEKFKELYDHAPVAYQEYDTEGRITNVNRTSLEMLGYNREEMIGQFVWNFNVEKEIARKQVLAKLAGTLPPSRNLERTYRRKDGTTFPVLIENRLILDEKSRIKGIRCTIQDITERKKVEVEVLRAKEAADAANRAKSEFLVNMSHEIRTPMNGIMGMTGLLLDTPLSPGQRKYVETVRISADALLKIVNDILDYSKIEAGKWDFEILDFDLRVTVDDTADILGVRAEEKNLRLAYHIHPDVPSLLR